jgi:hypothetical protein
VANSSWERSAQQAVRAFEVDWQEGALRVAVPLEGLGRMGNAGCAVACAIWLIVKFIKCMRNHAKMLFANDNR